MVVYIRVNISLFLLLGRFGQKGGHLHGQVLLDGAAETRQTRKSEIRERRKRKIGRGQLQGLHHRAQDQLAD
jgi:hypothetical protein